MYIDLLTKIKNAEAAKKRILKVRYSKMDYAILELLKRHSFIKRMEIKGRSVRKFIEIELNAERSIWGLKFLSRPSRHLYAGFKEIKKVKGGAGLLVISTSKGVMSGEEAKKNKIGGELLFEIW